PNGPYRGASLIVDSFQNPVKSTVHNGHAVVSGVLSAFEEAMQEGRPATLDIYVDLVGRSKGLDSLVQEFLELNWAEHFRKVRLRINRLPAPRLELPPHLEIESTDLSGERTEST